MVTRGHGNGQTDGRTFESKMILGLAKRLPSSECRACERSVRVNVTLRGDEGGGVAAAAGCCPPPRSAHL